MTFHLIILSPNTSIKSKPKERQPQTLNNFTVYIHFIKIILQIKFSLYLKKKLKHNRTNEQSKKKKNSHIPENRMGRGGLGNEKKNMHRHKITPVDVLNLNEKLPLLCVETPQYPWGIQDIFCFKHATTYCNDISTLWKNPFHQSVAILN